MGWKTGVSRTPDKGKLVIIGVGESVDVMHAGEDERDGLMDREGVSSRFCFGEGGEREVGYVVDQRFVVKC